MSYQVRPLQAAKPDGQMGSFAEGEQEKFTICSARYKAIYLQF
jgi:hypothetical protein